MKRYSFLLIILASPCLQAGNSYSREQGLINQAPSDTESRVVEPEEETEEQDQFLPMECEEQPLSETDELLLSKFSIYFNKTRLLDSNAELQEDEKNYKKEKRHEKLKRLKIDCILWWCC